MYTNSHSQTVSTKLMHDAVGPLFRPPLTCPGGSPSDVGPYKGFDNINHRDLGV